MATRRRKQQDEPVVYEQEADARGRIRMDRPFTGDEALAQDQENRKAVEEARRRAFADRTLKT